ncbi:MAG: hypothetical protein AB7K09_21780 [Planctomycetota bacterium]
MIPRIAHPLVNLLAATLLVTLGTTTTWADDTPSPAEVLPPRGGSIPGIEEQGSDVLPWLCLDAAVGYDFTRGHESSDVISGTEQITFAYGAMTVNLRFSGDLGRATGGNAMLLGVDGTFGFGSFIRFWNVGLHVQREFAIGDGEWTFRFGAGFGIAQLSAGGRDITDTTYLVLRNYLISTGSTTAEADEIAADETIGARINSPLSFYFLLQPGFTWQISRTVRMVVDIPLHLAKSHSSFELAGRTYDRVGALQVTGFRWQAIGVGLQLGLSIAF